MRFSTLVKNLNVLHKVKLPHYPVFKELLSERIVLSKLSKTYISSCSFILSP